MKSFFAKNNKTIKKEKKGADDSQDTATLSF